MKHPRITWSIIGIIVIYAIISQSLVFLNWDASWLLRCSEKILEGKHYYTSFIETNPPLIIWIGVIPVFFSKLLHLSVDSTFRSFIFFLSGVSLSVLYFLYKRLFAENKKPYLDVVFSVTTFVLLIAPSLAFGEREHICTILTMPYFFLTALLLRKKKVSQNLRFFIGVWAGLGFLIKPYFLLAFLLNEAYVLIKTKKLASIFRIETISIIILGCLYCLAMFVFEPNYLFKVLPLVFALYLPFGHSGLLFCLEYNTAYIWFFILALSFWQGSKDSYGSTIRILQLATIAFLGSYYWQNRGPYYHILPALSYGMILIAMLLTENGALLISDKKRFGRDLKSTMQTLILIFLILACILPVLFKTNYGSFWLGFSKKSYVYQGGRLAQAFQYRGRVLIVTENIMIQESVLKSTNLKSVTREPALILESSLFYAHENHWFEHNARFKAMSSEAKALFLADISRHQPGMIVTLKKEQALFKYLLTWPQFKAYFSQFHYAGQRGGYRVYLKSPETIKN